MDNQVTVISRIIGARPADELNDVRIAERRRKNQKLREWVIDHQWIDGRRRPALRAALIAINDLPPMRFGSADSWTDTGFAFDVPLTILRGPSSKKGGVGAALSRQEFLGPIADWRLKMERIIESCWRDTPVAIPGVTVIERLASEADAEAWAR